MALPEVGLKAVLANLSEFKRGADTVKNVYGELVSGADKVEWKSESLSKQFTNLGQGVLGLGATMAKVAAGGVAALGAGLVALSVSGVKAATDFQSQMAILSTAVDPATASLEDLHDAALAVGADTDLVGVSASEAADAMTGLYKAGLSTNDIFGDLQGYLSGTADLSGALRAAVDLQAASELDLAGASDVVAIAMSTFGLGAEDATRISDNFVQAADASVASVSDLAEGLKNVGPTAAAFGFSLEDTNNALALLSTRGISGAEAGTALKSMLTNIMRPTDQVKTALDELNVSLYDEQGTMRSLPDIIGDLERGMAGLTDEQRNQYTQTLAGTYGMKALQTFMEEGTAGWYAMADATSEASSASKIAETRTNTFAGAMEALEGTIETLKIGIGEAFLPVLTDLARQFADYINKYGPKLQDVFRRVADWLAEKIPQGVELLSNLWATQLQPALVATWQVIQTQVIPVLREIWAWLGENLPKALAFVNEHWDAFKGALIAIGAILAGAAIAAAIGAIVAAIGALVSPIGLVVAGVALLGAAWNSNFLGIRDTLTAFWENTAKPALTQLWEWLSISIPAAIQTLSNFWNSLVTGGQAVSDFFSGTLIPALASARDWIANALTNAIQFLSNAWQAFLAPLQAVWGFLNDYIIPIFVAIAKVEAAVLGLAVRVLAGIWQNILQPALQSVWDFLSTLLLPIFQKTSDVAETVVGGAVTILADLWKNTLLPAMQAISGFISDTLNPILEKLGDMVRNTAASAFEWLKDKVDAVKEAFESIKKAIKDAIDWIEDLADKIRNIKLPKWLEGHSPPPLAFWFEDVADAVRQLSAVELPRLAASLDLGTLPVRAAAPVTPAMAAANAMGGTTNTNNYFNMTVNTAATSGTVVQDFGIMRSLLGD